VRTYSQIGKGIPMYCSASGKVMLAWKTPDEILELIGPGPYKAYTPNTITTYAELVKQLREVRKNFYAVDYFEHQKDIYCISAPICDVSGLPIAAISLTATRLDMDSSNWEDDCKKVCDTAENISRAMGCSAYGG
jgi:DNA-binding IclR family transcriptional regulator